MRQIFVTQRFGFHCLALASDEVEYIEYIELIILYVLHVCAASCQPTTTAIIPQAARYCHCHLLII